MAGIPDSAMRTSGPWPQGINNIADESDLPRDANGNVVALRVADNVDLTTAGEPRRRSGYELVQPLSLGHSAWSHDLLDFGLYVDEGTLHALHSDGSTTDLGVSVGNLPLSYALLGDRIYYSNRSACGMLTLGLQPYEWAPPTPAGQPTVATVDGFGLAAGYYQVAITYIDLLGRESPSTLAAKVDVNANGGIELSAIPQPADAALAPRINVYLTGANDSVLRLATTLAAGTTYTVLGEAAQGRALPPELQLLRVLPAGAIVRGGNGRQYVAVGAEVLYSAALRYGLYDRVANRLRFSDTVTMLEPVGASDSFGLFVAAGKRTYWLGGGDPTKFDQRIAYGHGVVPGTSMLISADVLGLDTVAPVAVWVATNGQFCAGLPDGQVMPLKNGQAVVDAADRGAVLLREQDGIRQLIATLVAPRAQGLAVTDRAVATIIKAAD